ncbi:MAG TPA: sprT domain-containing protein, partial [Gammaproteobacteria bacterium]
AARMESIGLMPSHNGAVNGRKTGQTMSDYPIKGGKFIQACKALIEQGYRLSWIDRFAAVRDSCQSRCTDADVIGSDGLADADIEKILNTQVAEIVSDIEPVDTTAGQKTAKAKTKYVCERCAINLWGRPGLNVICGQCHLAFAQHV